MPTHLFIIVTWDRPDLWDYWRRWFRGVEDVQVILDRRRGERRRTARPNEPDRRRADRRSQTGLEAEFRAMGFAIVRTSLPA